MIADRDSYLGLTQNTSVNASDVIDNNIQFLEVISSLGDTTQLGPGQERSYAGGSFHANETQPYGMLSHPIDMSKLQSRQQTNKHKNSQGLFINIEPSSPITTTPRSFTPPPNSSSAKK
jgi:hypothetical protein